MKVNEELNKVMESYPLTGGYNEKKEERDAGYANQCVSSSAAVGGNGNESTESRADSPA